MTEPANETARTSDQRCGNCGAAVPADAVTCPSCGALLAAYQAPSGSTPGAVAEPPAQLSASPPVTTPATTSPPPDPQHRPASMSPVGDALRRSRATTEATDDAVELARMATTDSRLAREIEAQLTGAKVSFEGTDATIRNETGAATTDATAIPTRDPVAKDDARTSPPASPGPPPRRAPARSSAAAPSPAARNANDAPPRELDPPIPGFTHPAPETGRATAIAGAPARRLPVRPSETPREQWQEFEIEDLLSAETRPAWLTEKFGKNMIGLLVFGCVFLAILRQAIGFGGVLVLVVGLVALAVIVGMARTSGRKTTSMPRDKRR